MYLQIQIQLLLMLNYLEKHIKKKLNQIQIQLLLMLNMQKYFMDLDKN